MSKLEWSSFCWGVEGTGRDGHEATEPMSMKAEVGSGVRNRHPSCAIYSTSDTFVYVTMDEIRHVSCPISRYI